MSRLLLAALSLFVSVATSTFEYQTSSEVYPSSSKPTISEISPLQRGRDRRTTHWESSSNSNLDDDSTENDRDEGRGRISYSSFLEQRPSLGYPRRTEHSVKFLNAIDVTAANVEDNLRLDHGCVAVTRKPIVLVTFGDAKQTLNDVRDLQKSHAYSEIFDTVRCRRRINGWNLQEPFYVEEPGWIVIDLDGQTGKGRTTNEQDPFYVARGKRSQSVSAESLEKTRNNYLRSTKIDSVNKFDLSSDLPRKNDPTDIARIKRDSRNEGQWRSLLEDDGLANIPGLLVRKSHSNGYVQLRNKHSDILDILNEPFFISRGKKNSLVEWNNRYAKALEHVEARKQALDGYFSRASRNEAANSNCGSSSSECIVGSSTAKVSGSLGDPSPYRDRRGIMEELLKEADPFYVARGKRSLPNTLQVHNDKTTDSSHSTSTKSLSSTESIDDNSSVRVEH